MTKTGPGVREILHELWHAWRGAQNWGQRPDRPAGLDGWLYGDSYELLIQPLDEGRNALPIALAERLLTRVLPVLRRGRREDGYLCADYAVRRFAPRALRVRGLSTVASELESLPALTDRTSVARGYAVAAEHVKTRDAGEGPGAVQLAAWAAWAAREGSVHEALMLALDTAIEANDTIVIPEWFDRIEGGER